MRVLISDANIIIDMEDCSLTAQMLKLPYQFLVPDLLYASELEEHHPELLDQGLEIVELSSETMLRAYNLEQQYRKPSINDCFALAAAEQERCPLITGDGALRKAALNENVEIHGTLWVMEEMVINQLITVDDAAAAFERLKEQNCRLPWSDVSKLLERLR